MHYYLYEIKNNINGKVYVGVHKTTNLNDGYMGSGVRIRRAINKYGIENFTKTIIKTFTNTIDMYLEESLMVNEDFVKSSETYNVRVGGQGGFEYINSLQVHGFYDKDLQLKASKKGMIALVEKRKVDPILVEKMLVGSLKGRKIIAAKLKGIQITERKWSII
jgi:hypothetical protein